jgi:hypothetical protein
MKPDPAFKGFRLFQIDSSRWEAVPDASAFRTTILDDVVQQTGDRLFFVAAELDHQRSDAERHA